MKGKLSSDGLLAKAGGKPMSLGSLFFQSVSPVRKKIESDADMDLGETPASSFVDSKGRIDRQGNQVNLDKE